jgi:hypothetical protein
MSEEKQENQKVPFTYEESKLLMGCDPLDYVLYFRLKFKMDKETKLVGEKFKTSRRKLIEEMEVERQHGSNKKDKPITKDTLKACITRLERKGLVIVRSVIKTNEKRFIVELPKAADYERDKSVQNWNPPRTLLREPSCETIDITGSFASVHPYPQWGMNAPYQYININKSKDLFIEAPQNKKGSKMKQDKKSRAMPKRAIPDDFVVTDAHTAYATKHDLPSPQSELEKFINYYQSCGKLCSNWDAAFRNWLLKAKEYSYAKPTPFAPKKEPASTVKEWVAPDKREVDPREKEIEDLRDTASWAYNTWLMTEKEEYKEKFLECKQKLEALGVTL